MYTIRDLMPEDYEKVNELINDPIYERLFSVTDVAAAHVGGSYAAVAVTPGDGDVCAVLIAGLTPPYYNDIEINMQAGAPHGPSFFEYTRQHYNAELPQLTTRFLRMGTNAPGHSAAFAALLRTFFSADPRHEVLCMQSRPYAAVPEVLQSAFPELAPEQPLPIGACSIRACPRAEVLRPLTVTVAQMKDHDDLVKIFEAQQTHLRERFGEFYLADIISQADPSRQLALVGNDFEANSNEITHPVSFLYAEKYDPTNGADDQCLRNLQATHQLEAFGLGQVPAVRLAFIRATASSPSAESRSGDLLAELFARWTDIDAVLVSVPSAASCGQMQLLKLFSPVAPRSCLSPREALFACHRDAWINGLQLEKLSNPDDLIIIGNNLKTALRLNGQNNFPNLNLEVFRPEKGGTLAAYANIQGQRVAVAIASVDLLVGQVSDQEVFENYVKEYKEQIFKRGEGRVISGFDVENSKDSKLFYLAGRLTGGDVTNSPFATDQEFLKVQGYTGEKEPDSIWKPETCIKGRIWCHIHYGDQLEGCGYLNAFVVDPLFLQFKDDILDQFIAMAGVDALLLQVGENLQKCVRRVYDSEKERFESFCGSGTPSDALTSFERELFRQSDYVPCVNLLFNKAQTFYDGQLGQNYGQQQKPIDQYKSFTNSMYGETSKLHLDRQKDELLFNQKQEQDEIQDVSLAAIRSLRPHFSLFKLRATSQIRVFRPPTKLAGDPTVEYVVKPPSLLTDRLVVIGSGPGLLAGLEALQDCHPLARFQSVTVVHPPPGPIFRFNFDDEVGQQQLFDHGANLPLRKKRAVNMFYDVFIGDIYEVNVSAGVLKVAFGSEVLFDMLLICPDGSDSESLRQVPFYNLNSSVSFPYGTTDPCQLEAKQNILTQKSQLSELNNRGFEEETIAQVLGDGRLHCRLIQSLYQQMQVDQKAEINQETDSLATSGPSGAPQRFKQHQSTDVDVNTLLKTRLHARTFFRYLQRIDLGSGSALNDVIPGSLITRRQLAALACATMTFNLEFCVQQLYSPAMLKQLKQKEQQLRGEKKDDKGDEASGQKAAAGGQGESDVATQQAGGYKFLSPGAKSSQIIQIYNPQVQAELPLLINALSAAMMTARKELFPELYPIAPGAGDAAKPIKTCSAVDVARTTVCVYGDTFEAFAIIQAFLDRGVAPDSLVLLLPQDPNADVDPVDQKQNEEIDFLMAGPGAVRVAPRQNCHVPDGFLTAGGNSDGQNSENRMESKSTTQTADKRAENYPAELHKNLLQTLRLNGVNIKENVKIIDLYASITNAKKSGGDGEGEDGSDDDDEEESEPESSSGSGAPEDDEEFDETVEIDATTLKEAAEALVQLDELDICLTKKPGSFGGDPEDLNPILDQILLGRQDAVLKQQLGKDDADFAVSDLPADQREAEITRLVKAQLLRLQKKFKSTSSKKRRYRKKALNGSAFNGIRLQLLKAEEDEGTGALRSNIPDSSAHPRTFQSPAGSVRVLLNAADNSAQVPNQIDIQCCALFLTEPFGVPNNVSSALMRSDLVFDKALIVDPTGASSDPRVYASGNVAKINRETLLKQLEMLGSGVGRQKRPGIPSAPLLLTADPGRPVVTWSLYDAAETGSWAAYRLVAGRLGAAAEGGRVPEFARPLCLAARVPGGHVFRAARPLRDLRDPRLGVSRLFRTVKTGDLVNVGQGGRYCALDVDPLGLVDSMVVYSREPLSDGLKELVLAVIGLPVVLFNQLEQRWQREEVPDLLDFLSTYGPQMILSNPEMAERVNEMVMDVFNSPEFKINWGDNVNAEQVRGIADVPVEVMATQTGTDAVKVAGFASKLTKAARDLAREVEERFPELCRGTGSRGRVLFE